MARKESQPFIHVAQDHHVNPGQPRKLGMIVAPPPAEPVLLHSRYIAPQRLRTEAAYQLFPTAHEIYDGRKARYVRFMMPFFRLATSEMIDLDAVVTDLKSQMPDYQIYTHPEDTPHDLITLYLLEHGIRTDIPIDAPYEGGF